MARVISYIRVGCALLALGVVAGQRAAAQTIAETGDAGQTISTYQSLVGSGALTTITGTISSNSDVDIFRFTISNPATFSVTTATSPGTLSDTQLFLFTLSGNGIVTNDDIVSGNVLSTIPAGDSHFTGLTAGDYLLAISGYNLDASDINGNLIFPTTFPGIFGVNASVGPLANWTGSGSSGTYRITLTGATFTSAIPEPAATALIFAAGGAVVVLFRVRRSRLRSATEIS